jgi:hypothetical protein
MAPLRISTRIIEAPENEKEEPLVFKNLRLADEFITRLIELIDFHEKFNSAKTLRL